MEIDLNKLIRKVESNIRRLKLLKVVLFYDKKIKRDLKFFEEILAALMALKQLLKQEKTPN